MSKTWRIVIVAALLAAVGVVFALKVARRTTPAIGSGDTERALPTLVELDGGSCETCREMRPILEGLAKDYADRMRVEIIEVFRHPEARDHNILWSI